MERSGWNPNQIKRQLIDSQNVCIEYIALSPSIFDISKGKSYNEMLLIDKVIESSSYIKKAGAFFKVTGRFPILNLYNLLMEVYKKGGQNMQFYCDCKDHSLYDWLHLPINGHAAECRYYAISIPFYEQNFKGNYIKLCDYESKSVESFFLKIIRENKKQKGVHCRFRTQAHLTGNGGHTLGNGLSFFYSTNQDSASQKIKRAIRQLTRWLMPWWWL